MEHEGGRSELRSPADVARIARLEEEVIRLRARVASLEEGDRFRRRTLLAFSASLAVAAELPDEGEQDPAETVVDLRVAE